MIYFSKSDGANLQALLDKAKKSDNPSVYREGPVYEQLKADFHGKCYLCESNELTSIQIDHLEPHKNDLAKKYTWKNLFYSCGHCNNSKGAGFWPLLDCTEPDHCVWESIRICFTPFPKATVSIELTPDCRDKEAGQNTLALLEKVLMGKGATPMKMDEAATIRQKMLRSYNNLSIHIRDKDIAAIRQAISDESAFSGMLRWYLKNDFPELFKQVYPRSIQTNRSESCIGM